MFNYEQNKLYVSRDLSIFKTLDATMSTFHAVKKLTKQTRKVPYSFFIEGNYLRSFGSKNDLLEQLTCKFNASNENYFIDDLLRLIDFNYNNILNTNTSPIKTGFTHFPSIEESIESYYTPIIVYPLISESNKSLMNKFDNLNMALISNKELYT